MNRFYIKDSRFSLLYKFFFVIVCGYGLILHFSLTDVKYNIFMATYFTVLSNIFCFSIIAVYIALILFDRNKKIISSPLLHFLHGMALMSITLTFFIYNFMVVKYKYPLLNNNILFLPTKDLLAHYVVPLLFVIDWLLFHPKGLYALSTPLYWLIYPLSYLMLILFRAFVIPSSSLLHLSVFPYFFLDIGALGPTMFIIYVVLMITAILLISYSILLIEKGICLLGKIFDSVFIKNTDTK